MGTRGGDGRAGSGLRGALGRLVQGLGLWGLVGGPILAWWPPALGLPELWLVVAVTLLANVLQPGYALRPRGARAVDGTLPPIVLTVYGILAAALVELVLRRAAPHPPDAVAVGAVVAMLAGLGLRTWAVATLGRFFTLAVQVQPAQTVVDRGPYRLVRHPSYLGALVTVVASCVLLRAWVATALAATVLTLVYRRRIRYEEAVLRARLSGYRDYAARTGAMLPRWPRRGWRDPLPRPAPAASGCGRAAVTEGSPKGS
jgi:protein-S-isoprenylcysteine O-methyltransferase Ste14